MSSRQKYIITVVLCYLLLATGWIFLSDQLLLLIVSRDQLMAVSTLKGMLFVLITTIGFWLALQSLPAPAGLAPHQLTERPQPTAWLHYLLAALLVGLLLSFRQFLPVALADKPMMIIHLLPVILAAVLGGFGPGFFATVLTVGLIGWIARWDLAGAQQSLYLQLQWLFLIVNGVTISWLCQLLRHAAGDARYQQQLLAAVVEGTDDAIFIKDIDGRYQLVNQAAAQALGKPVAEILGQTDQQLLDSEQTHCWQQNDQQVLTQRQLLHFQEQMDLPSGRTVHYSVSKGPLFGQGTEVTGIFGIARDITTMLEQKRLLKQVLEGSEQGFWQWDFQKKQFQVSERFEQMLGYPQGDMDVRVQNWPQLLHPVDYSLLQQSIKQHLRGRSSLHEAEFRVRCHNSSWRWILSRGKIVSRFADGRPKILAGTFSDIEHRHQHAEALRLSDLMFTGSYDGIMLVSTDNRILRVNQAFCRITGYTEAEVQDKPPSLLSSGLHDSTFFQQIWSQLNQHGFWRGEIINKRKDGSIYTSMLSISVVLDSEQQVCQYIGIFADISQFKAHAAELDKVANFDVLTGLPNRRLLLNRFNQTLILAAKMAQRCAVCLIDIDNFKQINEKYGPTFGDQVLLVFSQHLQAQLRHQDTLARLGGDEFVVLLSDMPALPEGNLIVKRLLKAVNTPLQLDGIAVILTCSIGVSLYPDDNADPDTLLRHADKAMLQAKEAGRNRIHWFDPIYERKAQEHRLMLEQLREALHHQQFVLFYQPKVDLMSGKVIGVEALIRWQHPQQGLLAPAAFLSYIEGSELEDRFDRFVLNAAMQQAALWLTLGIHLEIGINISASHLLAADFADELAVLLQRYPTLAPAQIELEILESTAIRDLQLARQALLQCQKLGVRFALDDFGTGYSSLTYLRQLPVQCLKIDQSFVRDMLIDQEDLNIVQGVVQLAQVFNRQVIAEGVETIAHARALLALGCELAQGYGIARPMPAEQIVGWITQWAEREEWQQLPQLTKVSKKSGEGWLIADIHH